MSALPESIPTTVVPPPAAGDVLPLPLPHLAELEGVPEAHRLTMSLIVPATNDPATLPACLEAIRSSIDVPAEIIVVETANGPGAGLARNIGAAKATGDILVFVDSDVVVHPDAISRLHAHLEAQPETTAVFGSYDSHPSGRGMVSEFRNLLHHHVHQESGGPVHTFWAGLGAIRREAFDAAGGFDPGRLWLEDIDLGIRISDARGVIVLDPSIQATHLKRWSLKDMVRTDFHHRAVPWIDLIIKYRHASSDLNLSWHNRLSALAVFMLALALAARNPVAGGIASLAFVALNIPFYRMLHRRKGLRAALCGVFLHALHHAVSIAAVPYALARHLRRARS